MTVRQFPAMITQALASLLALPMLQADVTVIDNRAAVSFPTSIDFHLEATSDQPVASIELEFRTDALVCGGGPSEVTPDEFTGGETVQADWTWDLRRTGSLPPGSTVSWRWVLTTEDGQRLETPEEQIVITDDSHPWQSVESPSLTLYWYEGSKEFAQSLYQAGEEALGELEGVVGVEMDEPVEVYVYAGSTEMQNATLFAPDWSGGLAFPHHSALLLAVEPASLAWGQRALAHELTHVVIGRYVFSCVTSMPTWVSEGLAMYMEGEPEIYYVNILAEAVAADDLLSVRELGYIFSGNSELASLSYAQSLSLVTFLIEQHGQEKMLLLLDQFREGASEDGALREVYGLDRDELEAAWREWVGALPMQQQPAQADATRTPYPTLIPIGEPPQAVSEVRPTPDYLGGRAAETTGGPSDPGLAGTRTGWLLALVSSVVCLGAVGFLVVVVAVWQRRRRQGGTG